MPEESVYPRPDNINVTEAGMDSALYAALARLGAPKDRLRIRKGDKLEVVEGNRIDIFARISKAFPMAMANHIVQSAWREAGGEIIDAVETRLGRQVVIEAGVGGIITRKITISREIPEKPLTGVVALIIDDFGVNPLEKIAGFIDLPIPYTASIIPFEEFTGEVVQALSDKEIEIIVHMPMEPMDYPKHNPGSHAIYIKLPPQEIKKRIREAIEEIPTAVGMNNHMGSRVTSDARTMGIVAEALSESGLFFIDSRTSKYSCAAKEIAKKGIPVTCQNGNIDVEDDTSCIARRFIELALSSRENDEGILIVGHARPRTLIAINRVLGELDKWGIEFITASEMIARRSEEK